MAIRKIITKPTNVTPDIFRDNKPGVVLDEDNLTLWLYNNDNLVRVKGSKAGWIIYTNNSDPESSRVDTRKDQWYTLGKDLDVGVGATGFLPYQVDETIFETSKGCFNFKDLIIGQVIDIRLNFRIIPTENNTDVDVRINFGDAFVLEKGLAPLNNGAGKSYQQLEIFNFFIGSDFVRNIQSLIEIKTSSECMVYLDTLFVHFQD